MKKKLITISAVALVLALLLTLAPACGNGDEGEIKTLKIGLVFPLSGPAAPYGIDHEVGAKWAADKINEAGGLKVGNDRYMVEIVSCDSKYISSVAAECATRLVYDDGVRFALGPIEGVPAVDPIYEQNKVLYLVGTVSADPSPESPYMVNAITTTLIWVDALWQQMVEQHPELETIAVLNPDSTNGRSFRAAIPIAASKHGLTVVADVDFDPTASDFYPILTAIVDQNPDVIATGATPPGQVGLVVKQARELGYQGWILATSAAPTDVILSIAGPENMWNVMTSYPGWSSDVFPQRTRDLYQEWLVKYAAAGQTEMGITVSNSWKMMLFFRDAIEAADSIDPEEVLKVIDDPDFRFDIFAADNQRLGGIETFGIRRSFPHPIPYGEIIDADHVNLSMSVVIAKIP